MNAVVNLNPLLEKSIRMASWALDCLIPPRCLLCCEEVDVQGGVCASCWGSLRFLESPLCQQCGYPFDYALDSGDESPCALLCGSCMRHPPPCTSLRSLLAYDTASKGLLLPFKHGDGHDRAPAFAQWMQRLMPEDPHVLVPVPLHWTRLFNRTYNQAALLTRYLSKITGFPTVPDLLVRFKKTPSQGHLTLTQRYQNVRGAFKIKKKYRTLVETSPLVLVDDVLTTGATLFECARILNAAKAPAVRLVTFARVLRPLTFPGSFKRP